METANLTLMDLLVKIFDEQLEYMDPNTPMYLLSNGTRLTVRDIRDMVRHKDPAIVCFLEDVLGAAVRSVRVMTERKIHEQEQRTTSVSVP